MALQLLGSQGFIVNLSWKGRNHSQGPSESMFSGMGYFLGKEDDQIIQCYEGWMVYHEGPAVK
jgi:hypothetical protein